MNFYMYSLYEHSVEVKLRISGGPRNCLNLLGTDCSRSVGIATWLRAGRFEVRLSVRMIWGFIFSVKDQTSCGVYQSSC